MDLSKRRPLTDRGSGPTNHKWAHAILWYLVIHLLVEAHACIYNQYNTSVFPIVFFFWLLFCFGWFCDQLFYCFGLLRRQSRKWLRRMNEFLSSSKNDLNNLCPSLRRSGLFGIGILVKNRRRLSDRLKFIMGIPTPKRRRFFFREYRPWFRFDWKTIIVEQLNTLEMAWIETDKSRWHMYIPNLYNWKLRNWLKCSSWFMPKQKVLQATIIPIL